MARGSGPRPGEHIRVLRIIARLNIGGPAIHTILLTSRLNPNRFESTLVSGVEAPHEGNMLDLAAAENVQPIVVPQLGRELSPLRDVVTTWQLWRLVRRHRPHVVHTHTAKAGAVGRVAARLAGVPVIVHTFHGHVFHSYFSPAKTRFFLAIERWLARFTDAIVAVSDRQRQEIAGYGVAPMEKIRVIPLGFDLSPFENPPRGRFRAELGLSEDVPLVGIVARLTAVKNHELFLEVARLVKEQVPPAHFVIVGDGELRAQLENSARRRGLAESVIFTGWRNDLPQVYADLDVLVLTSLNEGTPVSVIEAMATGRPVVATRVGGVPDLVEDGTTGLLRDSGDAAGVAEAVKAFLADDELRGRVSQEAREVAMEQFRVERLVADMESLYSELLRPGPLPSHSL